MARGAASPCRSRGRRRRAHQARLLRARSVAIERSLCYSRFVPLASILRCSRFASPTRCTSAAVRRPPAAPPRRCSSPAPCAHTFVIGMQTMEAGHVPFAGTTQAISTFVWLLGARLPLHRSHDRRARPRHLHPADHRGSAGAAGDPGSRASSRDRPCSNTRCSGPTSSALLGAYASFGLAAVIGITYVLQFKEIKAKHLRVLLHAAAVAAGARRHELAHGVHRLDADDRRPASPARCGSTRR